MKLHSVVDIITNSSTVIFTTIRSDAIENTKLGIQAILDVAGVKQDVDELFNFSIELDEEWIEDTRFDWEYERDNSGETRSFEQYLAHYSESSEYGDHRYVKVTRKDTGEVVSLDYFYAAYDWEGAWS